MNITLPAYPLYINVSEFPINHTNYQIFSSPADTTYTNHLLKQFRAQEISKNVFPVHNTTAYHQQEKTVGPGRRSRGGRMPLEIQLVWAVLFSGMVFAAVVGNFIVIWSVIAHRRMRTVTNYFLVNLSLSDLLMSIFNCIFNFVYMINNDWTFGRGYCTINNYIANVSVAASVFTLTSITIDRYLAIITPLKPRMSKANAQLTILAIWAASLLIGTPCLLYSATITHKPSGLTACTLLWPDGPPMVSTLDHIYNLVLFLVTYIVPMSAMVGCYSAMGRELWGSRSIGELTQRQLDSIKSKRKVVRMLLLIVLVFGLCWLPYHAYFICTYHWPALVYSNYIQHVYLAFYWLAMSNAMLNPLIYYCMNQRFREYFHQAVCEWRCRVWSRESLTHQTDGGETPPIRRFSHSYSRSAGGTLEDGSESGARSRKREENGRAVQFAAGCALPLHHYTALQQIWSAHQLTNTFTAPAGCQVLYNHTDC